LSGTEGFINSGVQIRSQRVPESSEMSGFQCDYGDPNWWGAVYDESGGTRSCLLGHGRDRSGHSKRGDWNDYVIRAEGARITTWLNGRRGHGLHRAGPGHSRVWKIRHTNSRGRQGLVQVKNFTLEAFAGQAAILGAPEPQPPAGTEPLSPEEEQRTLHTAARLRHRTDRRESEGIGKL